MQFFQKTFRLQKHETSLKTEAKLRFANLRLKKRTESNSTHKNTKKYPSSEVIESGSGETMVTLCKGK